MHTSKKIKVTEVNPHLICVLCRGYYIDATTIIECLHSFCKTCIVKYLQTNKYCPICDVQIHKTSPLLNIRSDKTLQNIVYKLVPSLFKSEMERRAKFYKEHPGPLPVVPEDRGEVTECSAIILPEEVLVICMEYLCDKPSTEAIPKRFIHCPAEMTLGHLTRLIRGKFNLLPSHQVNILFKNDLLPESLTIMEVVYTYQLRKKLPVHLFYRILELKRTTIRLLEVKERKEESQAPNKTESLTKEHNMPDEKPSRGEKRPSSGPIEGSAPSEKAIVLEKPPSVDRNCQPNDITDSEWKEVQLQISENGVMSVRNMKSSECSPKPAVEAPPAPTSQASSPSVAQLSANMTPPVTQATAQSVASTAPTLQISRPATSSANGPLVSLPAELTTTIVPSNYTGPSRFPSTKPILSVSKVTKDQVKKDFNNVEANKLSISRVPAAGFKEKGEVLNKIVSKLSPNERVIGNTSVTIRPVLPAPPNAKTYHPPVSQAQPTSQQQQQPHQQHHQLMNQSQPPNKILKVERKPQHTLRYKTLTSPTKQWNPSIDRTTMLSMKQNYDESKPPRFFKMRNLPRYLGNPASGVKPIFGSPQPSEEGSKDQKARSPSKLPPPFAPGSPKAGKSPYPEKTTWTPRVPSPAHSASIYNSNPYLLYSGFPGSFNPDPSMLVNANPELVRSMFANAAYHPSLPPSINMLFNPLHNVPRSTIESTPSMQQRTPRTKSPSTKPDDKSDKPIPNLIPATISSSHSLPRSPTLPASTLGIPTVPSIPPHPSHPPGSLLPLGASSLPPRLHPPMSVSSPIHLHNSMLIPSLPLHPSHHNLGSPRAHTSPVGSPRTSSPLHISPPKSTPQPVYTSLSRSPKQSQKAEQQKLVVAKQEKSHDTKAVSLSSSTHTTASTPHAEIGTLSTPVPQTTPSPVAAPASSAPKPPPKTVLTSSSSQTTAISPMTVSTATITPTPAAALPTVKTDSALCEPKPAIEASLATAPTESSPSNVPPENPSSAAEECPLVKTSIPINLDPSPSLAQAVTVSTTTTSTVSTSSSESSASKVLAETPVDPTVVGNPPAEKTMEIPSKSASKSEETPTKNSSPSPLPSKEEPKTGTEGTEKSKDQIRSDNNNISKEEEMPSENAVETAVAKEK